VTDLVFLSSCLVQALVSKPKHTSMPSVLFVVLKRWRAHPTALPLCGESTIGSRRCT